MNIHKSDIMHEPIYCIVGGKSAGHILPACNIGYNHKTQEHAYIIYMSNTTQLDWRLVADASYVDYHIAYRTEGSSRYRVVHLLQQALRCFRTFIHAIWTLQHVYPDRVIATGGLLSVPVCIAAWLLHIPIEVYECNATPGKAVHYLSYIADTVNVCFAQARHALPQRACVREVSYPLAPHMQHMPTYIQAREQLGIDSQTCVVLVLGGSQGSWFINNLLEQVFSVVTRGTYMVFHQTGYHDHEQIQKQYDSIGITAYAFTFRSDIHVLYKAADCCIARAGAGTLFELVACQVPAYIIPLPRTVTAHQYDNAIAMHRSYPHQFWVSLQHEAHPEDVAAFMMQQYDHMPVHTPKSLVGDGTIRSDQLPH